MKEVYTSSAGRQKGLTGYCFKFIDRPFCLETDDLYFMYLNRKNRYLMSIEVKSIKLSLSEKPC